MQSLTASTYVVPTEQPEADGTLSWDSTCDNDRALMSAAKKVLVEVLEAAGATQTLAVERYAHLVGGARMAASAAEGVIDKDGRTFAIPNLWVAGGSGLPTQGSANPALTIMAMAARVADRMLGRRKPWTGP